MNERIEKLALQAGMHRDKYGMYFAGDKHDEDGVDLEKFAELIVKECAGIYDKIDNGNLHMGTNDYLEALHKTFFH
jgi:hypothetical protein